MLVPSRPFRQAQRWLRRECLRSALTPRARRDPIKPPAWPIQSASHLPWTRKWGGRWRSWYCKPAGSASRRVLPTEVLVIGHRRLLRSRVPGEADLSAPAASPPAGARGHSTERHARLRRSGAPSSLTAPRTGPDRAHVCAESLRKRGIALPARPPPPLYGEPRFQRFAAAPGQSAEICRLSR